MNTYFWDMDHTITATDCDVSWKEFLVKKQLAPKSSLEKNNYFYEQYTKNQLNVNEFLDFQLKEFKNLSTIEAQKLCQKHFEQIIKKNIYPQAKKMISEQKAKGFPVIIITATNNFIAQELANYLEIDLIATNLEVKNDKLTGKIIPPYCIGEKKLYYMKKYCEKNNYNFNNAYYYGDSSADIEIMQQINYPIATNPTNKLKEQAIKNNWKILNFSL